MSSFQAYQVAKLKIPFESQLFSFSMKLSNHVFINFNLDNLDQSMSHEDTNNSMYNETFEIQPIFNIFPKINGNANRTLELEAPTCFLKSESAR